MEDAAAARQEVEDEDEEKVSGSDSDSGDSESEGDDVVKAADGVRYLGLCMPAPPTSSLHSPSCSILSLLLVLHGVPVTCTCLSQWCLQGTKRKSMFAKELQLSTSLANFLGAVRMSRSEVGFTSPSL